MQESDYRWFVENYKFLSDHYGNVFLAIKNKRVLGVYSSYAEGVRHTSKTEEIGSFIVQRCNGDASAYTNYISSMIF